MPLIKNLRLALLSALYMSSNEDEFGIFLQGVHCGMVGAWEMTHRLYDIFLKHKIFTEQTLIDAPPIIKGIRSGIISKIHSDLTKKPKRED